MLTTPHFIAMLLPLYALIALGFIAGKKLEIDSAPLGRLLFYILVPIVIGWRASYADMRLEILALPLFYCTLCTSITLLAFYVGKRWLKDNRANILPQMSGMGNLGYFGLPVAMMLFDNAYVAAYTLCIFGAVICQNTISYYLASRAQSSIKESLVRVAKLPTLYAVILGIIIGATGTEYPAPLTTLFTYIQGCYVCIGLMIIGVGLSQTKRFRIDIPFAALALSARFILWPLLTTGFIALDRTLFHWFEPALHQVLILLSIMPIGADSVAMSAILNLPVNRVATIVFASTLIALFYIPIMSQWLL